MLQFTCLVDMYCVQFCDNNTFSGTFIAIFGLSIEGRARTVELIWSSLEGSFGRIAWCSFPNYHLFPSVPMLLSHFTAFFCWSTACMVFVVVCSHQSAVVILHTDVSVESMFMFLVIARAMLSYLQCFFLFIAITMEFVFRFAVLSTQQRIILKLTLEKEALLELL